MFAGRNIPNGCWRSHSTLYNSSKESFSLIIQNYISGFEYPHIALSYSLIARFLFVLFIPVRASATVKKFSFLYLSIRTDFRAPSISYCKSSIYLAP